MKRMGLALVSALAAASVCSAAFMAPPLAAFRTAAPEASSRILAAKDGRLFRRTQLLAAYPEDATDDIAGDADGLILNDIDSQMAKLRSKYPTSEADYLAAARARNAARAASVNTGASDEDWSRVAAEARARRGKGAADDDWESSAREAGNADSQILIPVDLESSLDSSGDEDEPKLLLF